MNVSNRHPGPFAAIGLLAAFAFAVIMIVAINGDSAWVYGENMLSDLGISDVQMTADLFNYGCMIVGILVFVYGLGKAVCETQCNRASGCILAIAAIFLVLIGYIHSDFGNGNTHDTIAILFFLFLFIAMVLSAIGALTGSQYEGSADYIYAMFGGLKVVDILYGLVLLAFAAANIYVRQQLAGFKRDSPKLFLTLYVAEAAVSLLYAVVVIVIAISGVAAYVSAYISPFELALQVVPLGQVIAVVIGAVIYVVLNKIYFDKRAHLFTN